MAHIGDVHDTLDIVALIAQSLFQHIFHNVGAQVANMGIVIDRRAAGVHFDDARIVGDKFFLFAGQRIIQIHRKHSS